LPNVSVTGQTDDLIHLRTTAAYKQGGHMLLFILYKCYSKAVK